MNYFTRRAARIALLPLSLCALATFAQAAPDAPNAKVAPAPPAESGAKDAPKTPVFARLPVAEYGRIEIDTSGVSAWLRPVINRLWAEQVIKSRDEVVRFRRGAPGVFRVRFESGGTVNGGDVRAFVTIDARTKKAAALGSGVGNRAWIEGVVPSNNPFTPDLDKEDIRAYPYPLPLPDRDDSSPRNRPRDGYGVPTYGRLGMGLDARHAPIFASLCGSKDDARERDDRKKREAVITKERGDDDKKPGSKKSAQGDKSDDRKPTKSRAPDPTPHSDKRGDKGDDAKTRRPTPRGSDADKSDTGKGGVRKSKSRDTNKSRDTTRGDDKRRGRSRTGVVGVGKSSGPRWPFPGNGTIGDGTNPGTINAPDPNPQPSSPSTNAPDPNPQGQPASSNKTTAPDPNPGGRGARPNRRRPLPSSVPLYDSRFRNFRSDAAIIAFEGALQQARASAEIDFTLQLRATLGMSSRTK